MPKTKFRQIHSIVKPIDGVSRPLVRRPPQALIFEAVTVPAYDEMPYVFDLEQGELLEFTFRSDIPVDVLLCSASDYDRWMDSGYDSEVALLVHLEAEDVLAYTLRFAAPLLGEYVVPIGYRTRFQNPAC